MIFLIARLYRIYSWKYLCHLFFQSNSSYMWQYISCFLWWPKDGAESALFIILDILLELLLSDHAIEIWTKVRIGIIQYPGKSYMDQSYPQ